MAGTGVEQQYRYVSPSDLVVSKGATHARLRTSSPGDLHPWLFSGRTLAPRTIAPALLLCATVARTRFYVPAATIARTIELADPVVTCHDSVLRFEVLSPCSGLYARLDVPASNVEGEFAARGSTNVEIGVMARQALGQLGSSEPFSLHVGGDEIVLETEQHRAVERRVQLPARWVKGLAEVQLEQQAMEPKFGIDAGNWQAFLRGLPSRGREGQTLRSWVVPSRGAPRVTSRPDSKGVPGGGIERLAVLRPIASVVRHVEVFGSEEVSAWVLDLGGPRITVVLSPAAGRGFSGEGGILDLLNEDRVDDADRVADLLDLDQEVSPRSLAERAGLTEDATVAALKTLGAQGTLGFDLTSRTAYHRPLPLDAVAAVRHPRLVAAQRLVELGAVTLLPGDDGPLRAAVRSGDVDYDVRLSIHGDTCSCPWFGQHQMRRGPCKHVLAARRAVHPR